MKTQLESVFQYNRFLSCRNELLANVSSIISLASPTGQRFLDGYCVINNKVEYIDDLQISFPLKNHQIYYQVNHIYTLLDFSSKELGMSYLDFTPKNISRFIINEGYKHIILSQENKVIAKDLKKIYGNTITVVCSSVVSPKTVYFIDPTKTRFLLLEKNEKQKKYSCLVLKKYSTEKPILKIKLFE